MHQADEFTCGIENGYRQSPESVALPGWRLEEIHRALTEEPVSEATWRALERVGRAMGSREGTRPEDDPLTRSLSAAARAQGRAEGRAEGRADAVHAVLRARGVPTDTGFAADPGLFAGVGLETLMATAQACTDEEDFRRRIASARSNPIRVVPNSRSAAPRARCARTRWLLEARKSSLVRGGSG